MTDDRVEFNISFKFNWLLLNPPQKIYIYTEILALYSKQHTIIVIFKKITRIYIYNQNYPNFLTLKKPRVKRTELIFVCQSKMVHFFQATKVNSATKRLVSPANKISLMAWLALRKIRFGFSKDWNIKANYKPTQKNHENNHFWWVRWEYGDSLTWWGFFDLMGILWLDGDSLTWWGFFDLMM